MNDKIGASFLSQFTKSHSQPSHGLLRSTFAVSVSPTGCLRDSVYLVTQDASSPPLVSAEGGLRPTPLYSWSLGFVSLREGEETPLVVDDLQVPHVDADLVLVLGYRWSLESWGALGGEVS